MGEIIVPTRAAMTMKKSPGGESADVFDLLLRGLDEHVPQALVTLVEVEGGSSREIGAQMAVLADGRYCGYLSGGCVEAAIAAEAVKAMDENRDAMLRFGVGSPFLDIRLPCGGSIEIHVHVHPEPAIIRKAAALLEQRQSFGLEMRPDTGEARLITEVLDLRTGWNDEIFLRHYAPVTRLLLIGRGVELEEMVVLGSAAGLDVVALCADDQSFATATAAGAPALRLSMPSDVPELPVDRWTAAVMLFHDHDWETAFLSTVVNSDAFFIGAMGSARTHRLRCERLAAVGAAPAAIARIHGPVGLFGPTRDATSLAVSILADVTQYRLQLDRA